MSSTCSLEEEHDSEIEELSPSQCMAIPAVNDISTNCTSLLSTAKVSPFSEAGRFSEIETDEKACTMEVENGRTYLACNYL